jgi:hypothetical protein
MESQTILTNYFTAAKSRQNSHPAKRRKVAAEIEVIPRKSAKLEDEKCVSLSQEKVPLSAAHVSRSTASSRTKQTNRSRTRNSKTRSKATQNKIVSESVVSVTTSLKDDHGVQRSRKQSQKNNTVEPSASKTIELASTTSTGSGEVKPSQTDLPEVKLTQTPEKTNTDSNSSSMKPANIASHSRTGLKIEPWIAEQAKLVLSSRGKQALEKSLGRKKATGSLGKMVKEDRVAAKETAKVEMSRSVGMIPKVDVPRLNQGRTTSKSKSITDER